MIFDVILVLVQSVPVKFHLFVLFSEKLLASVLSSELII